MAHFRLRAVRVDQFFIFLDCILEAKLVVCPGTFEVGTVCDLSLSNAVKSAPCLVSRIDRRAKILKGVARIQTNNNPANAKPSQWRNNGRSSVANFGPEIVFSTDARGILTINRESNPRANEHTFALRELVSKSAETHDWIVVLRCGKFTRTNGAML